jgi:hypothetical protein
VGPKNGKKGFFEICGFVSDENGNKMLSMIFKNQTKSKEKVCRDFHWAKNIAEKNLL